jgi:hypothetical protein
MNTYQELWWRQASSDHAVLLLLRRQGNVDPCHHLHYLQMVTEKVAKAFFWRSNKEPPRSHAGFVQFLRSLGGVQSSRRQQVADVLEFASFQSLQNSIRRMLPLAYELEHLAPALAQNGPNPEYPWPPAAPRHAPATFHFDVWTQLINTGQGRQLLQLIDVMIKRFPAYG